MDLQLQPRPRRRRVDRRHARRVSGNHPAVLGALERERLLRDLEVERSRLAHVFQQAPTFLAVLRGQNHVLELANEAYYQSVEPAGRPVFEALPEMRGQGFEVLLDGVLATGWAPFVGHEQSLRVARTPDSPPEERYVNFVYQPLIEGDGTRAGVVAHGSDVTEQVLARREVERCSARASVPARGRGGSADAETANRAKGEFLAMMVHGASHAAQRDRRLHGADGAGLRGPVTLKSSAPISRASSRASVIVRSHHRCAQLHAGRDRAWSASPEERAARRGAPTASRHSSSRRCGSAA